MKVIKSWPEELMASLPSAFYYQVKKQGNRPFLLEKQGGVYRPRTWKKVEREVRSLAYGMMDLGLEPKDRVALMMNTQANWIVSDMAIISSGGINVPIYATNKGTQIEHILKDSGSKIMIVGSVELLNEVNEIWNNVPELKTVIIPDGEKKKSVAKKIIKELAEDRQILEMKDVKKTGDKLAKKKPDLLDKRWQALDKHDMVSILYTSGTTGNPKGVMLSHDNFLFNVRAGLEKVPFESRFITLSFLPLSHVLERACGYYLPMLMGMTIAYAESIDTLADNMLEIRPHYMVSVPRIYEKVYDRITEMVSSGSPVKQRIFYWAKDIGQQNARLYAEKKKPSKIFKAQYALADKLVLKKIRVRFGGRVVYSLSGGAPLSKDLAEFFNGMGIRVLEGYGLTETSPLITYNSPDEIRYGSVGKVAPGSEVRIAEDGEILNKGPQNCLGYYNNKKATKELIDKDGWLHTGDIGKFDRDGFLFITDRKKDIIVTSGGKNVAPQVIEGLLTSDKYIAQSVIQGDKRNFLVAMIVPNYEALYQYAEKIGLSYTNNKDLINNPEIRKLYAERVGKALQKLPSFEQIKRIYLKEDELTMENKELTPTLKVKRRFVFEKYGDVFDVMYSDNDKGDYISVKYK